MIRRAVGIANALVFVPVKHAVAWCLCQCLCRSSMHSAYNTDIDMVCLSFRFGIDICDALCTLDWTEEHCLQTHTMNLMTLTGPPTRPRFEFVPRAGTKTQDWRPLPCRAGD